MNGRLPYRSNSNFRLLPGGMYVHDRKTFAHFEFTCQLGKGGVGEVCKAQDRKLGRNVAIKVFPEEFAQDADRVARFQREAKLLASLNHPNIAAIYGLEESNSTNYLILELFANSYYQHANFASGFQP